MMWVELSLSYDRFPFPWYFSPWTNGAPHHSRLQFSDCSTFLIMCDVPSPLLSSLSWNWGSSVSIVIRLRTGWAVMNSPQGQGNFIFSSPFRRDWLWCPLILISHEYRGPSLVGKAAEVKNTWRYTSTPPYLFMELSTGATWPLHQHVYTLFWCSSFELLGLISKKLTMGMNTLFRHQHMIHPS